MKQLHVADTATLPVEILQDSTTIFGRKRTGKSNNAVVLVEEYLELRGQTVILDPKGDWWGITSSFDGKHEGYPVVVIGGKHGTPGIELNPLAGAATAEWVLDTGYSVVIDLSLLKDAERDRFCAAFLETVRRRKVEMPGPILLVIDEADELAPEDQRERIHVLETYRLVVWMVKRGGFAGVATVLITQRPASLSKNVTTQSETLIVLQVSGSQDVDAVSEALKHHVAGATKKERTAALEDLLREIVQLDKGATVIVSAAATLKGKIHRIQFRRRRTFDSGATPEFGKQLRAPKVVAKVAIEQLSAAMQKAVADQKAKDPAELGRVIAALRKELEAERRKQPAPAKAETKRVEIPVMRTADAARLASSVESLLKVSQRVAGIANNLRDNVEDRIQRLQSAPSAASSTPIARRDATASVDGAAVRAGAHGRGPTNVDRAAESERQHARSVAAGDAPRPQMPSSSGAPRTNGLTPGIQRLLDTVALMERLGLEIRRDSIAAWYGSHPNSKGFSNNLSSLRSAGLLDGVRLTEAGRAAANEIPMPSQDDVRERILSPLTPAQRRIVEILLERGRLSRDDLAAELGTHPNSKGYSNNLSALRTRQLITRGSPIEPGRVLFLDGVPA